MTALPAPPTRKLRAPEGLLPPDRLAIWPTESGYGLDVTWTGPDGLRAADAVREALTRARIQTRLVQGLGRDWSVRVGPGEAQEVRRVLDLFLPA